LRKSAVSALLLCFVVAVGCSDDGSDARSSPTTPAGPVSPTGEDGDRPEPSVLEKVPSSDGEECVDVRGDLSTDIGSSRGVGSEPPGIDILRASIQPEGPDFVVLFETAGPIQDAVSPIFIVAQGDVGGDLSFELRSTRTGEGNWALEIVTWEPDEVRTSVANPVRVDGNTLSYTIPSDALPPLGLYIAFGAAAEVEGVGTVFDDCNPFETPPTTTPGQGAGTSEGPP
jgi:hypothetical protein